MPHRTRPLMGMLVFSGVIAVLVQTISPVYDFVCFLPYWERQRENKSGRGVKPLHSQMAQTQHIKATLASPG